MSRLLVALSALALAAACGAPAPTDANGDGIADGVLVPDNVSTVTPVTPVGSVSGQVVDSHFQALEGADVTLVLGGRSDGSGSTYKTTSDATGTFAFQNVPAGSQAEVLISKSGYGSFHGSVSVPAFAGQFPLNNGNANMGLIGLLELASTIEFDVRTATGLPANGAKALLEVTPTSFESTNGSGYGGTSGQLSLEATVNDQGILTFAGVPAPADIARIYGGSAAYSLTISALDVDGDGRIDFTGTYTSFSGRDLFTDPQQTITLADARTSAQLSIVASNLGTLTGISSLPMRNYVKAGDAIQIVFNQAVVKDTVVVKVTDENCGSAVSVTKTLRPDNTVLTITPSAPWTAGREYNLVVRATGLESGSEMTRVGFFFGADPAFPLPLTGTARFDVVKGGGNTNANVLENGDELYVTFSTPIHQVGGQPARAFISADLNGGGVGNGPGEYGAPFNLGFAINSAEITFDATNSTFVCAASGYTTRYRISYYGLPVGGVAIGTNIKVVFPADTSSSDGYQTIWGEPFAGEVAGSLTLAP